MRDWSPGRIGLIWAAWYSALAIVVLAVLLARPSFDLALPVPTRLVAGGREFGPRAAALFLAVVGLLLAALPPLVLTTVWWLRRR